MSAAGGHFILSEHLPAVIVVAPLIASGFVALFRHSRAAWAFSLIVAILPVGFFAMLYSGALQLDEKLGLPLPEFKTYEQAWEAVSPMAEVGFWLYFGGAAALLVIVLLDPGESA